MLKMALKKEQIGLIIIFILLILAFLIQYLPNKTLEINHRFVVCKITNLITQSEGSPNVEIQFYYKRKKFIKSFYPDCYDSIEIGRLLYVKLCPADLSNFEVDLLTKVNRNEKQPVEGWKEIP